MRRFRLMLGRLALLALVALLFSVIAGGVALAQGDGPGGPIPSWEEFLFYLSAPSGVSVVVGLLVSWLIEYVPQFEQLAARWKRLVFLGFSLLVPLAAAGLGVLSAGWPTGWDATWWPALVAGVLAFGSGTALHARKLSTLNKADLFVQETLYSNK